MNLNPNHFAIISKPSSNEENFRNLKAGLAKSDGICHQKLLHYLTSKIYSSFSWKPMKRWFAKQKFSIKHIEIRKFFFIFIHVSIVKIFTQNEFHFYEFLLISCFILVYKFYFRHCCDHWNSTWYFSSVIVRFP